MASCELDVSAASQNISQIGNQTGFFPYHVLYIPPSILGVVVNLFAIVIIQRSDVIPGKIPRLLLTNQCSSDLICCSLNTISWVVGVRYPVPANSVGTLVCQVWYTGFLFWSFVQASVSNLLLMTVERYLSVVHPILHRRQIKKTRLLPCILLCWFSGPFIESFCLVLADREGSVCYHKQPPPYGINAWGVILFCTFLVVPLIVLLYCNTRMVYVLRSLKSITSQSKRFRVRRQLSYTTVVAGVSFLFCFAPNTVVFFLRTLSVIPPDNTWWFYQLTKFLVTVKFTLNPLLYVLSLTRFRQEAWKTLCCSRGNIHPKSDASGDLPSPSPDTDDRPHLSHSECTQLNK